MTMQRREFVVAAGRATLGVSLLPFAACSRPSTTPPATRDAADLSSLIDDLESQIPELLTQSVVPGLSMAIISKAVQWRRGFGVKDAMSRAAVDDDTVFEVGSVSKTVFAYAVMKLCEKGALDLDTPLTTYSGRSAARPHHRPSCAHAHQRISELALDVYERRAARPHDAQGTPSTRKATASDAARYGAAGGLRTTPGDYAKFTHRGSNPGFQALIAASVRSKSGFVIATNGDNGFDVIKRVVSGDRMRRFLNVRV